MTCENKGQVRKSILENILLELNQDYCRRAGVKNGRKGRGKSKGEKARKKQSKGVVWLGPIKDFREGVIEMSYIWCYCQVREIRKTWMEVINFVLVGTEERDVRRTEWWDLMTDWICVEWIGDFTLLSLNYRDNYGFINRKREILS